MANYIPLNTLTLPGLSDIYYVPKVLPSINSTVDSPTYYPTERYVPSAWATKNYIETYVQNYKPANAGWADNATKANNATWANNATYATNANRATYANQLVTGRTFLTNLSSTTAATFYGNANVTPGITGILSGTYGGSGYNTVGSGTGVAHTVIKYRAMGLANGTATVPGTNGTINWAYG